MIFEIGSLVSIFGICFGRWASSLSVTIIEHKSEAFDLVEFLLYVSSILILIFIV